MSRIGKHSKAPQFFIAALFLFCALTVVAQKKNENFSFDAYHMLELTQLKNHTSSPRKIRIAVVDDGFNLQHELIAPYLVQHPADIPNNKIDDDNNGYTDDHRGWNVSDNHPDVNIVPGREREIYHGTMVTSIITTLFEQCYGSNASQYLEIIPIKAVSNTEAAVYVKDGYKGIAYALTQNVDIICCAWSGGNLSLNQKMMLEKAQQKGILIIGATGNNHNKVLYPASTQEVIAVTAIDSNHKVVPGSNTGIEVDFCAAGTKVRAGHPLADNAYFYGDGSSAATALITGMFGVLKTVFPNAHPTELKTALTNSAKSLDQLNPTYAGRLGAGIPQLGKALDLLAYPEKHTESLSPEHTRGILHFYPKHPTKSYTINLPHPYYGIEFQLDSAKRKKFKNLTLEISGKDTAFNLTGKSSKLFSKNMIQGSQLKVTVQSKKLKAPLRVRYQPIVLDSSKLYCKEIQYLYVPMEQLEDGSGPNPYANKCDCKWVIRAPEGKKIQLDFTQMNTQANRDFVWVFNGEKTLTSNLLAKFSGTSKPPIITSLTNEVLIWFLSDDVVQGDGWQLKYNWVD